MTNLYVPIIDESPSYDSYGKLYNVTCKKQSLLYKDKGSSFNGFNDERVAIFNNCLKNSFYPNTFSFKILENDNKQAPFINFSEKVSSISLGIFCAAYKIINNRSFKKKYFSITVTGKYNVLDGKVILASVKDIDKKYEIVKQYAKKYPDENHLFLYISSEEVIPDGIQDNNIFVIRYDSNFPIECIFAEIYNSIDNEDNILRNDINEFIETQSFIKLKKDFVTDNFCNGYIIKGESNTGKTIAAKALCRYLIDTEIIKDYVMFYVGDNSKFRDILKKEKELRILNERDREKKSLAYDDNLVISPSYVKDYNKKVFNKVDELLAQHTKFAIVIDNIELNFIEEILDFFKYNYPNIDHKYKIIISSWYNCKVDNLVDSLRIKTMNISDVPLKYNEIKALTENVIRNKKFIDVYQTVNEEIKKQFISVIFNLCKSYPGYIPILLSSLKNKSIEQLIELYSTKNLDNLRFRERILSTSFSQIGFLSKLVLFEYIQIKDYNQPVNINEIKNTINNSFFIHKELLGTDDILNSITDLVQYSFFEEKECNTYLIKAPILNYCIFSQNITKEMKYARNILLSPKKIVEYAIENDRFEDFSMHIDEITRREDLIDIEFKLCNSSSNIQFFELLGLKNIDWNYMVEGLTPLHICSRNSDNPQILQFLIASGAHWYLRSQDGSHYQIIHYAAMNENSSILKYILENHYYSDIDSEFESGDSPLQLACKFSAVTENIQLLLDYGADKEKNRFAITLLQCAARNNNINVLRFILDNHLYSKIDEKDCWEKTPLQFACQYGDIEHIQSILQAGADKNVVDNNGYSILHYAAMNSNNSNVLKFVVEKLYSDSINKQNGFGETALSLACNFSTNIENVKLLIEKYDANINVSGYYNSPNLLPEAALNKNINILKYLLLHHYYNEIDEMDDSGYTALHLICRYKSIDTDTKERINLLLQYGAKLTTVAENGNTILHSCAKKGKYDILEYVLNDKLIKIIDKENNENKTALQLAIEHKKDDICRLLLKNGAKKMSILQRLKVLFRLSIKGTLIKFANGVIPKS